MSGQKTEPVASPEILAELQRKLELTEAELESVREELEAARGEIDDVRRLVRPHDAPGWHQQAVLDGWACIALRAVNRKLREELARVQNLLDISCRNAGRDAGVALRQIQQAEWTVDAMRRLMRPLIDREIKELNWGHEKWHDEHPGETCDHECYEYRARGQEWTELRDIFQKVGEGVPIEDAMGPLRALCVLVEASGLTITFNPRRSISHCAECGKRKPHNGKLEEIAWPMVVPGFPEDDCRRACSPECAELASKNGGGTWREAAPKPEPKGEQP